MNLFVSQGTGYEDSELGQEQKDNVGGLLSIPGKLDINKNSMSSFAPSDTINNRAGCDQSSLPSSNEVM